MAAETINELTTGVLTQAISAGGSLFTNQLAGYQDRGAVSGNVLIRDFRTRNAISFTQAQSICNALMQDAGTRVWELHAENAAEEVIETFNFTVTPGSVEFFDHGPGGVPSRRYRCLFQINMTDFEEAASIWPTDTVTDSFEVTREQQFNRDITSHRNFNFNNTVTLDLIRNATQLGTNAAGMIVPSSDTPIRITVESDNPGPMLGFPTNPNRGDYHILEAQFTTTEGGIEPLMTTNGDQVTFNTYIPAPFSVGQSFSGFDNIAFSHGRGTIDPPLGVAGQPVEVHYRQSASDPWILVGTTTDSSPNGNQLRVRFEEGADFGNIQLNWEAGFRSGSGTAGQMFDPGTYIFDGDGWIQISGNTSAGDGVINGARFETLLSPTTDFPNRGTTILSLTHSGSSSVVQTAVPDIWPNYLRTASLIDLDPSDGDDSYRAAPAEIGAAGQVLRVEGTGAAARLVWGNPSSSSLAIENSEADILSSTGVINFDDDAFDVTVDGTVSDQVNVIFTYPLNVDVPGVTTGIEDFPNVRRLQIGDGLTFTPTLLDPLDLGGGFLGTLSVAGATITVEGNDGNVQDREFTGTTLIDFNPTDFLVTSTTTGEVVISSIGGQTGTSLVLEDDATVGS